MSINRLFRVWFRWKAKGLSLVLVVSCWLVAALPAQAQATTSQQVRISPTNNTTFITKQRFDLRVESLIPAKTKPTLQSITINGNGKSSTDGGSPPQIRGARWSTGRSPEFGATARFRLSVNTLAQ